METVQRDSEMINMFSCGPNEADGLKLMRVKLRYSSVAFPLRSVLTSANMLMTGSWGVHIKISARFMDGSGLNIVTTKSHVSLHPKKMGYIGIFPLVLHVRSDGRD